MSDETAMIPEREAAQFAEEHRCGECGGPIRTPWDAKSQSCLALCITHPRHKTFRRINTRVRRLYDPETNTLQEYDIMTQQPIGQPLSTLPTTEPQMTERLQRAFKAGLFPAQMTPDQQVVLVKVALAYGFDPLMREIMPYQGQPYITIAGRRRKDAEAGHKPSIRFRFLTPEEKAGFTEAQAISDGDLMQVCILKTEDGAEVEAFGKVTLAERQAMSKKTPDRLASPVVAANPIEMAQKRAERRAREIAYGPIPRPPLLDMPILQEGDEEHVVEGTGGVVTQSDEPSATDLGAPRAKTVSPEGRVGAPEARQSPPGAKEAQEPKDIAARFGKLLERADELNVPRPRVMAHVKVSHRITDIRLLDADRLTEIADWIEAQGTLQPEAHE